MAIYHFGSDRGTRYVTSFDPATDVISFSTDFLAYDLRVAAVGNDALLHFSGQLGVWLPGVDAAALTGHEFQFANGTVFRQGAAGPDLLTGSGGSDRIVIEAGGDDTVQAGAGSDLIFVGSSLSAADSIDGGASDYDELHISGNYDSTVVLGAGTITGVEYFVIGPGGTVRLQLHEAMFATTAVHPYYGGPDWLDFEGRSQGATDALMLDGSGIASSFFEARSGAGADTLLGGGGNDRLEGGAGDDSLHGGAGNDLLSGDAGADLLLGAAGNDTMWAGSGNDTLDPGDGTSSMTGGEGDDTFVVRSAGDQVVELDGLGNDTVLSYMADYTLSTHVENGVVMAGPARLVGNGLDNRLAGGEGDDTLEGGGGHDALEGGAGADLMVGGLGDDTYHVRHEGDVIVEVAGEGSDRIVSYFADYTLWGEFENGGIGLATGGRLQGTDAANDLAGGAGDDTLVGGLGDDSYHVDNVGDVIVEFEGEGTDTAVSTIDWTLQDHLEDLVLVGAAGGTGNDWNNRITGGLGNNVMDGAAGDDTMAGGAGDDTYHVHSSGDVVIESAGEGTDGVISRLSSYTLGANVENGTIVVDTGASLEGNEGNNGLLGGAGADTLLGGAGADALDGGAGADWMAGGTGDDTYHIDTLDDVVLEADGAGTDRIVSHLASFTLAAQFENGTIGHAGGGWLAGNAASNALAGGAGDDTLLAGEGHDTLDGGAGRDSLQGGMGDDVYHVDHAGDVVVESDAAGSDTVFSLVDWTLGANFEHLVLAGVASVSGAGNHGDNRITGNAGANFIDGGLGADTMAGGAGDDTYSLDSTADVVVEAAGQGADRVLVDLAGYTLGEHFEHGTILFAGGGWLLGNGHANDLVGGEGNDILSALDGVDTLDGGAGADTLYGGSGNDIYVVDHENDAPLENGNGGTDSVRSSIDWSLSLNLEHLTLTGEAALHGVGNYQGNLLTGNAGANLLEGLGGQDTLVGGAGHDTLDGGISPDRLEGGAGDDVYRVDRLDIVVEADAEGTDTVEAALDWTLGEHLEVLVLVGAALAGTGNELDNVIRGNGAANVIDGGGGADHMAGAAGDDTYHVDHAGDTVAESAGEGTDTIVALVSHTLGDHQENLTLAGAAALVGTGNALANVLRANEGANTLAGGEGDDTYHVDADDTIVEWAGGGIDTVVSGASLTLGEHLENLLLTGGAALHAIGNTEANFLRGNTGANLVDGAAGTDTMEGGDGDDVYLVDHAGDVVVEAAGSTGGTDRAITAVDWTMGAHLEGLELGGTALRATGNAQDNVIVGNTGDNTLDGGDGSDTLRGGGGDDTYVVNTHSDVVEEAAAGGVDTVIATGAFGRLGEHLENLALAGTAYWGIGNELANVIRGSDRANYIDGGAGADTMAGGGDSDHYFVDDIGDVVRELQGEGEYDTVTSNVFAFTLPEHVERLYLETVAVEGRGNAQDNAILGNGADNVLDGRGGADWMYGSTGDDTYHVDHAHDEVLEHEGYGNDTVLAGVSYTLVDFVENLVLTGTAALRATGNAQANVLRGNAGANTLDGAGGADTMSAGLGADTYHVDHRGDDIAGESSSAGGGIDTVITSIDWAATGRYVEIVRAAGGTASIDLKGNTLANTLIGNDGRNILDGWKGADVMRGGKGNDTYHVDNARDSIDGEYSASSGGIDTVFASISWSLIGDYVENLTLTGSSAINGTGNKLANVITGNGGKNGLKGEAGNDTLQGGGGADSLTGGSGSDRFAYTAVSESTSKALDRITDFTRGSDKIDLSHLDGNAGKSGHQDFSFIGSRAFSANATGQLRFAVESGKVMLYGSTDADASAEFAVQVAGATLLSGSDFVF
ncbi:MAG: M10 family metallopeptidase C-terminal domain-containing protein [Ramlibacter sp.]